MLCCGVWFPRGNTVFLVDPPEVQIVPNFAATLASLLLIASAIGINIARYPQVGRTVDAGQRTDAAETPNSTSTAQAADRPEAADPNLLPRNEVEIEPQKLRPAAPVVSAVHTHAEKHRNPKAKAGPPCIRPELAVAILDVQPIIPISSPQPASDATNSPAVYDEVRRLPPVEQSGSAIAEIQALRLDEAQPYTTTSTP